MSISLVIAAALFAIASANYSITVSDPTHRRGRVLMTPVGGGALGTMCSNYYSPEGEYGWRNGFLAEAANVTCTAAGFPSPGGAFSIPNFGDVADGAAIPTDAPIYVQSVGCTDPTSGSLAACSGDSAAYIEDVTGCSHLNDAGVLCPTMVAGGGLSSSEAGGQSTVFTFYLSPDFPEPCASFVSVMQQFAPAAAASRFLTRSSQQAQASVCRVTVSPSSTVPVSTETFDDGDMYYFLTRVVNSSVTMDAILPDRLKVLVEPNVSAEAYLEPAPEFGGGAPPPPPQEERVASVTVSEPSARRGALLVTLNGSSVVGTVCSNYVFVGEVSHNYFDRAAANVTCHQAGLATEHAIAIPNFGQGDASGGARDSMPILLGSVSCPLGAASLGGCTTREGGEGCTHVHDAGVVCPLLVVAPEQPPLAVTMFTAFYQSFYDQPRLLLLDHLAPFLPAAALELLEVAQYLDPTGAIGWAAAKFYVRHAPASAVPLESMVVNASDVEYALARIALSPLTWLALNTFEMRVEEGEPPSAVNTTPVAPQGQEPPGPPPSGVTVEGTAIDEWTFRLVNEVEGMPATRGVVEARAPQTSSWGGVCSTFMPSQASLYAVCRKALNHTAGGSPWPYTDPVTFEASTALPMERLLETPAIVSDIACFSMGIDGVNSTQLAENCTFTFDNASSACSWSAFLAIDCNPVEVALPSRTLTAVVLSSTFTEPAFRSAWAAQLFTAASDVVISSTRSFEAYLYVDFTFNATTGGGSSFSGPFPHSGSVAGSSATGESPPGLLLDGNSMPSGSMPSGSIPASLPGSGSMSGHGSMPGLPPFDPDDHINYQGTPGQVLSFRATTLDAGTLWQQMGIFELRDNTTVPNGDGFSVERSTWMWRWSGNGSIAHILTRGEAAAGMAMNGSAMVGRPELRIGADSPWGTLQSSNVSAESVAGLCALLGAKTSPAAALPHVLYGEGVVYLSDVACASLASGPGTPCAYSLSSKYEKRNNGSHVDDLGLMCGSMRPDDVANRALSVLALLPASLPASGVGDAAHAAEVVQCMSRVSAVPSNRVVTGRAVRENVTMFNFTTRAVQVDEFLNISFALVPRGTAPSDATFSSGDLLMMLNATNRWSYETLCGVTLMVVDVQNSSSGVATSAAPLSSTSIAPATLAPTDIAPTTVSPGATTTTGLPATISPTGSTQSLAPSSTNVPITTVAPNTGTAVPSSTQSAPVTTSSTTDVVVPSSTDVVLPTSSTDVVPASTDVVPTVNTTIAPVFNTTTQAQAAAPDDSGVSVAAAAGGGVGALLVVGIGIVVVMKIVHARKASVDVSRLEDGHDGAFQMSNTYEEVLLDDLSNPKTLNDLALNQDSNVTL